MTPRATPWLGWLALAAVYLLWGTTYNAIALGDRTMPPLLFAGTRFLIAGLVLFPVAARGSLPWQLPRREWISTAITGLLMLAGGNGLVRSPRPGSPAAWRPSWWRRFRSGRCSSTLP